MDSDTSDPSLYLILHRVRGEPAFDVAQRATYGSEEGWCIPTSGHRAFPYQWWNLDDLRDTSDINHAGYSIRPVDSESLVPGDWPDHYAVNDRAPRREKVREALEKYTDKDLLDLLDLVRKADL